MNPAMDSEAIETAAADWFARQHSGRWSDADQAQLDAWLDSATAHRVAFVRLNAAWSHSARLKALGAGIAAGVIPPRDSWTFSRLYRKPAPEAIDALEVPRAGIQRRAPEARTGLRYGMAASFVLAIAAAAAWYFVDHRLPSYETKIGATQSIPLDDGSRVTLNTASQIRVALNQSERRIELKQGEAFFDVAKDTQRPFTVIAGEKRIVAVGTRFSVRRETDSVRVVVTEGRVRLENGGDAAAPVTQLDAGTVAKTRETAVSVQQKPLSEVEQLLSWRTGYVTFRDTDLAEAVAEFNRYSSRKIVIQDADIAHIRIGGNFRTDNAEAFLWLLQNGFAVDVEQQGDSFLLNARR